MILSKLSFSRIYELNITGIFIQDNFDNRQIAACPGMYGDLKFITMFNLEALCGIIGVDITA